LTACLMILVALGLIIPVSPLVEYIYEVSNYTGVNISAI